MPSELTTICRAARADIDVPATPLAAIRYGAAQRVAPPKQHRILPIVLSGFAIALVAAAVAGWKNTYVTLGHGYFTIRSQDIQYYNHPTTAELAEATKHADFHVMLPAGLPRGAKLTHFLRAGSSALLLFYSLPSSTHAERSAQIILANPKSFAFGSTPTPPNTKALKSFTGRHIVALFALPGEMVIVPQAGLTTKELNHMEQAMHMGHWRIVSSGGLYIENPTAADITNEARKTAFHVVVPSGFPAGSTVTFVGRSANGVALQYSLPGAWRADDHLAWVLIARKSVADNEIRRFMSHFPHGKVMARFDIGDETVVFPTSSLTKAEIAKIRRSMGLRQ